MGTTSESKTSLSATKRALMALKDMQAKLDALETAKIEPIAVIGMGCRFPGGANSPEDFWRLVRDGKDAIAEVPSDRWNINQFYDPNPDAPGKMSTRFGGFLDQVDQFDADFFGITPREAAHLDPQQRLLLEVSWEALESANQVPETLYNSLTGVFVGICISEYTQVISKGGIEGIDAYCGTGNALSVAAGRLSYSLGLTGPSLSVDTACSSSLVTVHLACQSLRNRECDAALAGGVNVLLSPEGSITFSKARMMAANGRCKTFDAAADGYVRGEGCGIILLKRLSDAIAADDNILALIRGSAVNQDGPSGGLTVPNGPSQVRVIRQALSSGEVDPEQLSYIEAHGTGTSLGDPIEVEALGTVFAKNHSSEQPLTIGSVKTNIGHLEGAAGIAGLIKVILSLQHETIPPHLYFQKPNPYIGWDELPFQIPTAATAWPRGEQTRLAGVSSFGFSGTNAHVVLEEAPVTDPVFPSENSTLPQLLTLSAKAETALPALAQSYLDHLGHYPELSLADLCYTSQIGRTHFSHRMGVVADSRATLQAQLEAIAQGDLSRVACGQVMPGVPQVAFLFTGQGSQYGDMGRSLFESCSIFRQALEECDRILQSHLDTPLLELLYGSAKHLLDQTTYTQPVLFSLEYALAQLWQHWGVTPAAVMGHSIGEFVAACIAGVFSLEDGLKLVAHRGRLMQTLPSTGAMLSVLASVDQIRPYLEKATGGLTLAAHNGPTSVVLSGETEAIETVDRLLGQAGIKTKRLVVSQGFHSPLMEPMVAEFREVAESVTYSAPQLPLVSNLTGQVVDSAIATADYWCQHIVKPVQFANGMQALSDLTLSALLEVGPHPVLLGMGRSCVANTWAEQLSWLPSLRRGQSDWAMVLEAIAGLYVQGVPLDWSKISQEPCQQVALPTYPFQRQRYWVGSAATQSSTQTTLTPVLEQLQQGKIETLTNVLQQQGSSLSTAEQTALPRILELLAQTHQRQEQQAELQGWCYELQWQPVSQTQVPAKSGNWLILADQQGIAPQMVARLEARGCQCYQVYAGSQWVEKDDNTWSVDTQETDQGFNNLLQSLATQDVTDFQGILYLWGLETATGFQKEAWTAETLATAQQFTCGGLLTLMQVLAKHDMTGTDCWVLTQGAAAVDHSAIRESALVQTTLWGLGRVLANELSDSWGGLIDLPQQITDTVLDQVASELVAGDGNNQLAWRSEQRYVARLVAAAQGLLPEKSYAFSAKGTYLITGGLGALGQRLASWLIDHQGVRSLALIGRKPPSAETAAVIDQWQQTGITVEVIQADVTDRESLHAALQKLRTKQSPLKGVFHVAGVLADGLSLKQAWSQFAKVLAPKVQGTWNLHTLTQTDDLEHFVCFSSVASVLGSVGQSNYAAANAFLDGLMQHRQTLGLPGLSINWGPWAETGMAAESGFAAQGIDTITPEKGLELLSRLLSQPDVAQIGVLPVNWQRFRQVLLTVPPLLEELLPSLPVSESSAVTTTGNSTLLKQLQAAEPADQEALLLDYLRSQLQRIAGLDYSQVPDAQRPLQDFGTDSLMLAEFRNRIKTDLTADVPLQQFFGSTTLADLAAYLHPLIGQANTSTQPLVSPFQPVSREQPLPLSYNQELAWIMNELEPRSGVLLMLARIKLLGRLNIEVFARSLTEIVRRHEILRTTFRRINGQLQAVIAPESKSNSLTVIDLSDLPEAAQQQRLQQLDTEDATTPFDLENGPLMRTTLLQLGPQEHVLLLSMHHIVTDMQSFNLFARELATVYSAFAQGQPSPLPDLPIQYVEFTAWQHREFAPEVLAKKLQQWQQQIGVPLPVVDLPTDRSRPAIPSYKANVVSTWLSADTAHKLREFSKQQGLTLFMVLTCGFKLLLARYTGQMDLLLVAPTASRTHEDLNPLIGFFANAVVMRTQLGENPTVEEALERVRHSVLEAQTHQALPFIKLVESLDADSEHDPLARVWIDMIGARQQAFELPGLSAEFSISNGEFGSKFDLLLGIAEQEDGLELKWIFSTDLFDVSTIEQMAHHYAMLLSGMMGDVKQQISALPMLTESEMQQLAQPTVMAPALEDSSQLLDHIDDLSDENVDAMLAQLLSDPQVES